MTIPRIEQRLFNTGIPLDYEGACALFNQIQRLIDAHFTNPALECSTAALWTDVLAQGLLTQGDCIASCSNSDGCRIIIGPMLDMHDMITIVYYPTRLRQGELKIRIISQQ